MRLQIITTLLAVEYIWEKQLKKLLLEKFLRKLELDMKLKTLNSNSICAEGKEYMNWIPISELKNHKVYPTFFADKLKDIPDQIVHIVTKELTENTSLINNVKEQ